MGIIDKSNQIALPSGSRHRAASIYFVAKPSNFSKWTEIAIVWQRLERLCDYKVCNDHIIAWASVQYGETLHECIFPGVIHPLSSMQVL